MRRVNHLRQLESVNQNFITSREKCSRWILPTGSKRFLFAQILIKFVRNPIRFLRKCSPTRVKKFFKILRWEGVEGTSSRLDDCLVGSTLLISHQISIIEPDKQEKQYSDYEKLYVPQWEIPVVSIVIPAYNHFEYTYLCIRSILKYTEQIPYEIILADDCSTDLTVQIEEIVEGLHTIHNSKNLRFLRNCNNAAEYACGEYILFLNNDTQVQENWLPPLIELIEKEPNAGLVGAKLIYPDGRLQEAGGILWRDGSAGNYGNRSNPNQPEFNYVKDADYVTGACMLISRHLWKEIGGFDERFVPAYCEDSDLALEVRKRGYRVLYQPRSIVVHFEGVSNGSDLSTGQKTYQIKNQVKLREKWKEDLERDYFERDKTVFRAREHGMHQKTLLMIDHYVPRFDQDAGSKTVFQYIQLFRGQGYHITFIGDNFYPYQPYTQILQQMGVEVLYGPTYKKNWINWLRENGREIQYVFLNRPHISEKYVDVLRKMTNARIIYYGHDLHFLREQREYEQTGCEEVLKSSKQWKKRELALMRKVDISYYPSHVEEDIIHQIAPDICVKSIPAYLFTNVSPKKFFPEDRKNILFIGGFAHRPNVDAVIWLAQEIMPRLQQMLPEVVVYVLGSHPPEILRKLESKQLHIKGFVTEEELYQFYSTCRLDIVPLRYGAGIKGKVIEAMRFGLPIITTTVGAEGLKGTDDFLIQVDEAESFASKIVELYNDFPRLKEMSAKSIQYIAEQFSPSNAVNRIGADFDMEWEDGIK